MSGDAAFAVAGRDVATNVWTCCIGACQGTVCILQTALGSHARGDVIRMNLTGIEVTNLQNHGTIKVPDIGSIDVYRLGNNQVVFASFSLTNLGLNPEELSVPLRRIILEAKAKNPKMESMIWVGQVMPGQAIAGQTQVQELTESYTDLQDLSAALPITYTAIGTKAVKVTIPASKNKPAQTITVDFKQIARPKTPARPVAPLRATARPVAPLKATAHPTSFGARARMMEE